MAASFLRMAEAYGLAVQIGRVCKSYIVGVTLTGRHMNKITTRLSGSQIEGAMSTASGCTMPEKVIECKYSGTNVPPETPEPNRCHAPFASHVCASSA